MEDGKGTIERDGKVIYEGSSRHVSQIIKGVGVLRQIKGQTMTPGSAAFLFGQQNIHIPPELWYEALEILCQEGAAICADGDFYVIHA